MIDLKDLKIIEHLRKNGYLDKRKTYHCFCDKCNKDKGYQTKSRYNSKPLCVKCATNTPEHKNTLSKNHWSKNDGLPWNKGKTTEGQKLKNRIGVNLRCRLNKAIKGNYKSGSAVRDLGCSIEDFKKYMELRFEPEMTWNNWSRKGWHVDHIVPLSSFDLSDREQLKRAVHYTNLQPLWAKDNLSKSNRISDITV